MGLYLEGPYIREEKHFNLESVKLISFLSFFQILQKPVVTNGKNNVYLIKK